MSQTCVIDSEYPTIEEIKYFHLADKKSDCAVYIKDIPLIFIRNPRKINLGHIQFASGLGIIFFRVGAEDKARKIGNLFSELDGNYSDFLNPGSNSPERSPEDAPPTKSCTELLIPTGIEPHDGIEYVLMSKGLKHVALFEYSLPIEFLTNPLKMDLHHKDYKKGRGRIYYTPGHEFSANELRKELNSSSTNPYDEDRIRRVGRILGYPNPDIEQFIEFCRNVQDFYA